MKAEHRHELETNALADKLGHWYARLKSGDAAVIRWVGVVVAVVVAVVVWRMIAANRAENASGQWVALESANTLSELERFAEANPNSTAAKVARLHEARVWLGPDGIDALQQRDADRRKKAVENIEKARAEMAKLADEFRDNLVLRVQCLVGVAKAEEALIGLPKAGSANDSRGSWQKAEEAYRAAAAAAEPTPLAEELRKAADRVKAKEKDVAFVHGHLDSLMTPPTPSLDPVAPKGPNTPGVSLPGIPGGPTPVPPTPPMPNPVTIPQPPTGLEPKAPTAPDAKADPKTPAPTAKAPVPPTPVPTAKGPEPKAATPPAPAPTPKAPGPPPATKK